jgi:hypothetical protein
MRIFYVVFTQGVLGPHYVQAFTLWFDETTVCEELWVAVAVAVAIVVAVAVDVDVAGGCGCGCGWHCVTSAPGKKMGGIGAVLSEL